MPLKSINFIKEGNEPVPVRNTQAKIILGKVKEALAKLPAKESLVVDFDGTKKNEPGGLTSRLRAVLDPKKFEAYHVGNQTIIRRVK